MTINAWLEVHRELLHSPPDATIWKSLVEHWSKAPPELEPQVWLSQAEHALASWPDELRQFPPRWLDAAVADEVLPEMALGRTMHPYVGAWRRVQAAEHFPAMRGLSQVRHLALGACELGSAWPALLNASWTSGVRSLGLASNNLGGPGMEALASNQRLSGLEALDLRFNAIGVRGVTALQRAPFVRSLRTLRLGGNNLGVRGARRLARAPLESLRELDVSSNLLTDDAARALCEAAWMPGLRSLDAQGNELAFGAMDALGPTLGEGLEELKLRSNALGPGELRGLLRQARLPALRVLDVSSNRLDAQDAALLGEVSWRGQLEQMLMEGNRLGDEGARHVAEAPHLQRLLKLSLGSNGITDAGVEALAEGVWPALTELTLHYNQAGVEGLRALSRAPWFAGLEVLLLSGNAGLGDEGAEVLAQTAFSRLRLLGLSQCGVTGRGAEALSKAPWLPGTILILSLNPALNDPTVLAALKARARSLAC